MPIVDIIPMFPSTVVVGEISTIDNDAIVDNLLQKFKDNEYYNEYDLFHKSESNLHTEELYQPLVKEIHRFVDLATSDVFQYENLSSKITLMWAIGTKPGHNIHRHYHPNSLFSGVYYPQNIANYAPLRFYTPRRPTLLPSKRIDNIHNSFCMTVQPKQGTLVMFPSYLDHDTIPSQHMDGLRLSIAFNLMFTGEYGQEETLSKLTLKELQ